MERPRQLHQLKLTLGVCAVLAISSSSATAQVTNSAINTSNVQTVLISQSLVENPDLGGFFNTTSTLSSFFGPNVFSTINNLNNLLSDIIYYGSQLYNFYNSIVTGNLNGIIDGVNDVIGVLGIPDPDALSIQEEVVIYETEPPDLDGGNDPNQPSRRDDLPPAPPMGKKSTINEQIARGITLTTLSKKGQEHLQALQNSSDELTKQAWVSVASAQKETITQNVMKAQAKIQATQTQLERIQSAQLQNIQLAQASGNLLLENINGGINEINYARLQQERQQAALMQTTGHLLYLPGLPSSLNSLPTIPQDD